MMTGVMIALLIFVVFAPELLLFPFIFVFALIGAVWEILTGKGQK